MPTTTQRRTTAKKAATSARSATARAAKAPADHKPKDSDVVVVEVRGIEWTVAKDTMDDFELLDDLNALDQRDDATRMPSVLRRFLGDEQFTKAMDLLRKESKVGRVTIEEGSKFVWELIGALNPNS